MSSHRSLRQTAAHRLVRPGGWFLVLLAMVLGADAAAGQAPVLALEFNFSNPGARSMGFGVAFDTLQLDLAVDFSDLVDTASLSAIYSF